ncbi:MAG: hypothetical protein QX198_13950 [Methylococcaceae bacterium]
MSRNLEIGEEYYRSMRGQGLVLVDINAIEHSIISGEAGHALYNLMSEYKRAPMPDGKLVPLIQRAMAGWLLRAGTSLKFDGSYTIHPISTSPSSDVSVRRAGRILAMILGYQRIRIAPGMASLEGHWCCDITAADNTQLNGWELINREEGVVSYSTGDEDHFLGWSDASGKNARQLAQMFITRFPNLVNKGAGRDCTYAGWFVGMLGAAENGRLPIFFADYNYNLDSVESEMPPPFFCAQMEADEYKQKWITNEDLHSGLLPCPDASWEAIKLFCLTFDGYANGRRSIDECFEIVEQINITGLETASLDDLRITLFIKQRAIRWNSHMPVSSEDLRFIKEIIEEIRRRLSSSLS